MRTLTPILLLALVFATVGCSSNHASLSPTGPLGATASLAATPTPADATITSGIGLFGEVSDLSGGDFTLTSPDGRTWDISTTPSTIVRYESGTSDVGSSALADGEMVTVVNAPTGLPSQVQERAILIVINNSYANQQVIADK